MRHVQSGKIKVPAKLIEEVTDFVLDQKVYREYETLETDISRWERVKQEDTERVKGIHSVLDKALEKLRKDGFESVKEFLDGEYDWYLSPRHFQPSDMRRYIPPRDMYAGIVSLKKAWGHWLIKENKEMDDKIQKSTNKLKSFKKGPVVKEKWFELQGSDTVYPQLQGRSFKFRVVFGYIDAASWNLTDTISVSLYIDPNFVEAAVEHELAHMMQTFMSKSEGSYPTRGLPPIRVRTPDIKQNDTNKVVGLHPSVIHDLDDVEFHTEFLSLLRYASTIIQPGDTVASVIQKLESNSRYLYSLRSTPISKGKYQLTMKMLYKELPKMIRDKSVQRVARKFLG